jgi:hypothetical protein
MALLAPSHEEAFPLWYPLLAGKVLKDKFNLMMMKKMNHTNKMRNMYVCMYVTHTIQLSGLIPLSQNIQFHNKNLSDSKILNPNWRRLEL